MIDYFNLALATQYYSKLGFEFINVPWIVSEKALDITAPPQAIKYPIDEGFLVASGEQSFLELILTNKLALGRWGCVTSCFRGDSLDKYHQRYFVKAELIDTRNPTIDSLEQIITYCLYFFCDYIPDCRVISTAPSDPLLVENSAKDIYAPNGIELGSYGIREHPDIGRWIYATGCAEPRLSIAIAELNS